MNQFCKTDIVYVQKQCFWNIENHELSIRSRMNIKLSKDILDIPCIVFENIELDGFSLLNVACFGRYLIKLGDVV